MSQGLQIATVMSIALLVGCHKTVTIRAVEPGVKEIIGITRLAVLDLTYTPEEPDVGRNIANVIVAELDETGAFEVMERSAVARVLEEQKFGSSGVVDTDTVTSIGKLLGVDGVVVGEVVAFGADKKLFGKAASIGVNIRIVDVESAKVVFSDSIIVNTTKSESGEDKQAMLSRVSQEVANKFVAKIAPHYVDRKKFLLSTGGDAGTPNKRGITFATNGLWDKAREQFEQASQIDPQSAAVQNNLGVCAERDGKLTEAIEFYEQAITLDPDDEQIQKNLASLRGTFRGPELTAKEVLERHTNNDKPTPP